MTAPDTRRLLAWAGTIAALAIAGCGSSRPQPISAHPTTPTPGSSPTTDGATAIFRADVTPIVCRYAQDVAKSTQRIAQASSDAGGPVNASAPQSAQAEYAGALQRYASVLATDYAAFGNVHAPAPINREYQQFRESLDTISHQAHQLAHYARARNFTAIANEQNLRTPSAGQRVFHEAGITSCAAPRP
jgi:hypothetical protein